MLLVSTADVARGNAAVMVAATGFRLLLQQRRLRSTFVQLLVDHTNDMTASGGSRLALDNCHLAPLLS